MDCGLYEPEQIDLFNKIEHIYIRNDVPIPSCKINLQSLLGGNTKHSHHVKGEILSAVGKYIMADFPSQTVHT